MTITKKIAQKITVEDNGILQVKDYVIIEEDGVEISRAAPHAKVIDVEDDVTAESDRIKSLASTVWTQEIKDARKAEIAAASA